MRGRKIGVIAGGCPHRRVGGIWGKRRIRTLLGTSVSTVREPLFWIHSSYTGLPGSDKRYVSLQHDGAPPHFAHHVSSHLCRWFPKHWVREVREELSHEKIRAASRVCCLFVEIKNKHRTFRMLKRNFIRRCSLCVWANCRHFDHFLWNKFFLSDFCLISKNNNNWHILQKKMSSQ